MCVFCSSSCRYSKWQIGAASCKPWFRVRWSSHSLEQHPGQPASVTQQQIINLEHWQTRSTLASLKFLRIARMSLFFVLQRCFFILKFCIWLRFLAYIKMDSYCSCGVLYSRECSLKPTWLYKHKGQMVCMPTLPWAVGEGLTWAVTTGWTESWSRN